MDLTKFQEYLILNNIRNNSYVRTINRFLVAINGQEITKEIIEQFILRTKETLGEESVNLYLKAIKRYLDFLGKDIPTPKLTKPFYKLPDSFTLEYLNNEIMPMIDRVCKDSLKIKTIFYFMFYTGIRVPSELKSIQRKDIDLKNRSVKLIEEKTHKERWVTFPKRLIKLLQVYFASEQEVENAFNVSRGKLDYIFQQLKPYFPNMWLRARLFRHSFATHLFKKKANIVAISKLMGHRSVQSTLRYIGSNSEVLKELYDEYFK